MLYKKLKPYLDISDYIEEFDELVDSQNNLFCSNLNQTGKALLVSRLFFKAVDKDNSILFITADCNKAEAYYDDFSLLLGADNVSFLPDFETLPYEERSPHYSIRSKRLKALERALSPQPLLLIVSVRSLLRKILCPHLLQECMILIGKDTEIDLDDLCSKLINFGYVMENEVTKVGDISRRGGILDIYTPSREYPVRLELFGDSISSIRYFDPISQKSTVETNEIIKIIPAREVSLYNISSNAPLVWEKIHQEGVYDGIEQDLSVLYENTSTVIDYLIYGFQERCHSVISIFDEFNVLHNIATELIYEANELYQKKLESIKLKRRLTSSTNMDNLIPKPEMIFEDFDALVKRMSKTHYFSSLQEEPLLSIIDSDRTSQYLYRHLPSGFSPQTLINRDMLLFGEIIKERVNNGWHIFIQSDNISQSKRMSKLLDQYSDKISFEIGVLHRGFDLPDAKLALYTDHEIFNRYKQKKYQEYFPASEALVDYESLSPGDYIVHIEHGIGLYEGLRLMTVGSNQVECLTIRYADQVKVYVPTYQLQLVTRYISEDGVTPELHKLGGKRWQQSKNKAKRQIELIADDLVNLYAERVVRKGIAHDPDPIWQNEMEESFIYEDTPDQRRATEEIKADMELDKPMERLLCGDVGFGKTEVAIRAAFKAVTSGWQVGILVPTTLLAEQHFIVFQERLAQYPINISMLSRFRTAGQMSKDLVKVKNGSIDIVIGTHRLLSKDIVFKKLGLLIIDEEHRFGVRHKDKIRKLKTNIDTLYMSATPIPRTLNMALVKLKEMSLIRTSPKARLPIRTNIIPYNINIIKDAIKRELDRSGQILFVHNRIESISSISDQLQQILPKARIAVGHGRLPEKQLEKIILDFYDQQYDILVCTTIIESGIDIPNANTIFINRADMFGLAQLYQIRGRVGRSNRRAYAYLIIPNNLSLVARKRLEALSEYNTLGSGYQIAMKDLEIRGAGSLLGTRQSGVINSIGFNYYNRLLSEAIDNLVKGKDKLWNDEKESYIDKTQVDADYFFPNEYIKDEKTRLDFYSRMLSFNTISQFDELKQELIDRFGPVPSPANRGLLYFRLRLLSDRCNLDVFRINKNRITIGFKEKFTPPPQKIKQILASHKYPVDFDGTGNNMKMIFTLPEEFNSDKDKILLIAQNILYDINCE